MLSGGGSIASVFPERDRGISGIKEHAIRICDKCCHMLGRMDFRGVKCTRMIIG